MSSTSSMDSKNRDLVSGCHNATAGRLQGKCAFITGGACGIGSAVVHRFCQEGCSRVVFVDIDSDSGQSLCNSLKMQYPDTICTFRYCDVSNEDDTKSILNEYFDDGLDILVNNAACFIFGKIEDVTNEELDKVFGVNVKGYCWTVKHALPFLKKSATPSSNSSIINIGSVSSFIAQPSFVPYNMSKGAIIQLTRCLALDLAPDHIRVNAVCPGGILTPATERHAQFENKTLIEMEKDLANYHLIPRLGRPDEVANAVLFLASNEASFITGHPLMVDGGWSTR